MFRIFSVCCTKCHLWMVRFPRFGRPENLVLLEIWKVFLNVLSICFFMYTSKCIHICRHVWFPFIIISHIFVSTGKKKGISFQLPNAKNHVGCPGVLCSCRRGGATYGPDPGAGKATHLLESADRESSL